MTLPQVDSSGGGSGEMNTSSKSEEDMPEVKLLFFGTFFHENTGLQVDLINMKETTQITEIRVIPLGATVDLSTGAFQLGATNPSEFALEVYYNDLQVPTKSTFELLRNFKFNDKSRIQLVCDPNERIITDGLLVRGIYSCVTLAVYGFTVDKVPIKELVPEVKEQPVPKRVEVPVVSPHGSHKQIESPEKFIEAEVEGDAVLVINEDEREAEAEVPVEVKGQAPQAIPTITTRVNYDPGQGPVDESFPDKPVDLPHKDSKSPRTDKIRDSSPEREKIVHVPVEVMDTEEISDGEVFPDDDEDEEMDESRSNDESLSKERDTGKVESKLEISPADSTAKAGVINPLIEEVEPISSPPQEQISDAEDSLFDEFQEPFEEIISDEEMPDFPEYDYGEWEENWAHKFTKTFNPFSESFQVFPLQNIRMSHTSFGSPKRSPSECWEVLLTKAEKLSRANFRSNLMESWVEDIERLIPLLPSAMSYYNHGTSKDRLYIEMALWLWVDIGTDLKMAMEQPSLPFKTRHIKAGVRLIQCLANLDGEIVGSLLNLTLPFEDQEKETPVPSTTVQHRLIDLLTEPFMNIAARLLILRTLDSLISTRFGFAKFIGMDNGTSCYQRLVDYSMKQRQEKVDTDFSSRISFAFRNLHRKVKLMQGLLTMENRTKEIASNSSSWEDGCPVLECSPVDESVLEDLLFTAHNVNQLFSHPLRILPASSIVELPPASSPGHDPKVSFVRMLKEMNFVQVAAVIVSSKVSGTAVSHISELVEILLRWEVGLIHLCNESDGTTLLLRSLLQLDEDLSGVASRATHCMEVMKCVDVLSSETFKTDTEEEKDEDLRSLQTIVSFLTTSVGRDALSNTLSKGDFIVPFLKCVKSSESDLRFGKLNRLEKSARKGYAIEILDFLIRFCDSKEFLEKHGPPMHTLISSLSERTEGNEKLLAVQSFLKLVLNPLVFTLDGVETLCDIVKSKKDELLQLPRSVDTNWGFPAEMITALRILCGLSTSNEDNEISKNLLVETDEALVREMKYDLATSKLYSLDMISTLTGILQKVMEEFQQSAVHSYVFVSARGDALLSMLLPVMKILKKTISQVVQIRKAEFRDVAAVPVLVKLYGLVEYYPTSAMSYGKAQEVGQNIVNTLLAYTVPAIKQGAETEDELNKSTWTAVVSEIIKFTLDEPATFQPGLALFTELLPLPFPIASKTPLSEETCQESIKLRRLWSAYIHGLSPQLQEMIGILCTSTNARLITLLKRVCVQLADLSAATCLVVCRAILDAILQSMEVEVEPNADSLPSGTQSSVKAWVDTAKGPGECQCSSHTSRILGFLASLINNYAPMKCGILHAMKGTVKVDEKYGDLLTYFCSVLITKPVTPNASSHIQGQDHVVTIFQSFCDVEINMFVPMFGRTEKTFESEFLLTNSLPQRDSIISICSTLLTYLIQMDEKLTNNGQIVEGILRTLEIISETDYGFYHLRVSLEKAPGSLAKIVKSLISSEIHNPDIFEALMPCTMSFLDLMKSVTTARPQPMGSFPPRITILTPEELGRFLEFDKQIPCDTNLPAIEDVKKSPQNIAKSEEDTQMEVDSSTPASDSKLANIKSDIPTVVHPLTELQLIFEKLGTQLKNGEITIGTAEPGDLEIGLLILNNLLRALKENRCDKAPESSVEVILPQSESLSELFSLRPVFVLVERMSSENMSIFWLTSIPPAFELDAENGESELVQCDLEELCKTYLGNYDVIKEIDNLTKASALQVTNGKDDPKRPGSHFKRGDGGMRAPPTPLGHRRHQFNGSMRGLNRGGFNRALLSGPGRLYMSDPFRSRPPNTSRPPSLHVDDFVAMESSGQSGTAPSRPGGSDNFSNRGRGSRGGNLARPYSHERGRNARSGQGQQQGGYYQRHETSKGRGSRGGGRVYTTPTSDRWTADSRGGTPGYERNNRTGTYDDKYNRSGSTGPNRNNSVSSSPRAHLQPYSQRPGYRDARPAMNNSPRWRDRQRPFNR